MSWSTYFSHFTPFLWVLSFIPQNLTFLLSLKYHSLTPGQYIQLLIKPVSMWTHIKFETQYIQNQVHYISSNFCFYSCVSHLRIIDKHMAFFLCLVLLSPALNVNMLLEAGTGVVKLWPWDKDKDHSKDSCSDWINANSCPPPVSLLCKKNNPYSLKSHIRLNCCRSSLLLLTATHSHLLYSRNCYSTQTVPPEHQGLKYCLIYWRFIVFYLSSK